MYDEGTGVYITCIELVMDAIWQKSILGTSKQCLALSFHTFTITSSKFDKLVAKAVVYRACSCNLCLKYGAATGFCSCVFMVVCLRKKIKNGK